MTNHTRYEATDAGVDIVVRGREEWRKSFTCPAIIGQPTWENIASLLNCAYQRGRLDQQDDVLKVLGVK